jgi:hypothetical protein
MDFAHIDIGNLLTMLTVIGTMVAGVFRLLNRIDNVSTGVESINKRIGEMETELKKQTDILIELAQTRERMNALEKRIDDLSTRVGR